MQRFRRIPDEISFELTFQGWVVRTISENQCFSPKYVHLDLLNSIKGMRIWYSKVRMDSDYPDFHSLFFYWFFVSWTHSRATYSKEKVREWLLLRLKQRSWDRSIQCCGWLTIPVKFGQLGVVECEFLKKAFSRYLASILSATGLVSFYYRVTCCRSIGNSIRGEWPFINSSRTI